MLQLTISKINDNAYRVQDEVSNHVGNLKFIAGLWKFKAIGYDAWGDVIPGGGPLTDRHNTTFTSLNVDEINIGLLND